MKRAYRIALVTALLALSLALVTGCSSGGGGTPAQQAPSSGGSSSSGSSSSASGDSVSISNFAFSPANLTVKVGSTVTWTNQDSVEHTVVADDDSFKSNTIASGSTFSQTFTKAGTVGYHCGIHPSMKGQITVQ